MQDRCSLLDHQDATYSMRLCAAADSCNMKLTLCGSTPALCVGWSGWDRGTAGTGVAEVAAPSGRLWLMNVNFCQARSPCSPGSIRELGWTRRKHTHTHTHTKDRPHLSDGWYGSRTTHRFSISVSFHSAVSLILPAPINLWLHVFLLLSCWVVCFPSFMLHPVSFLPFFVFWEMCWFTDGNTNFPAQPQAPLLPRLSPSVYFSWVFLLTWHWDASYINQR